MKKFLIGSLAALMLIASFAACGEKDGSDETTAATGTGASTGTVEVTEAATTAAAE